MDVARTALRKGSREVIIVFRGSSEQIEADKIEVEYAKIDGVRFEYNVMPVEILDSRVKYVKTKMVLNQDGYFDTEIVDETEYFMESDSVIVAIGQGPRANVISTTKGIEVSSKGLLATDEEGRTTRDGVFASGDVVTGAKTVVEAVRLSKIVADVIDNYVKEKSQK